MKRVLLRAELEYEGDTVVAHTLELSEREVFIETHVRPEVGTTLHLRLSFPRLVEPIDIDGKVTAHCERTSPGEPSGLQLMFKVRSPGDGERLQAVLATIAAEPTARALEGFHVLLVEDNHLIRDMFSYGIRKYFRGRPGYVTVDHASDGAAAWQMLASASYDLAIVDYYLPVLDGAQLVQRMRSEPRLQSVPIVAISVGGSEAREATLAAGADLFLDKPLVLKDLFATLERLNAHGGQR